MLYMFADLIIPRKQVSSPAVIENDNQHHK